MTSFIYSPIHLFSLPVTHLGFSPCLSAHTGIIKTLSKVQCEGEREREREAERERARSRSQDALWVSLLNEARSTVHGAPSAEHTSKPVLHLYCQHLEEERRGARVEQPLSGAGSLPTASLVDVPFKLPTRATKLLMCLPHYRTFFTFTQFPVSFILLTSHFLLASSAFSSVFFTLTSSCFLLLCVCVSVFVCY